MQSIYLIIPPSLLDDARLRPTGASIPPETMMHFPPVSDFRPILEKNFTLCGKFSQLYNVPFPDKFSSANIFFSHRPQISNFPPIFPVSVHSPPVSRKLLFPSLL